MDHGLVFALHSISLVFFPQQMAPPQEWAQNRQVRAQQLSFCLSFYLFPRALSIFFFFFLFSPAVFAFLAIDEPEPGWKPDRVFSPSTRASKSF